MIYKEFKYPIMLEGEAVIEIDEEDDTPLHETLQKYCPKRIKDLEHDIWPTLLCFKALQPINQVHRIAIMDDDTKSFKQQVREMFPEWTPKTRNDFRTYIGKHEVDMMFFQNLWLGLPLNDSFGVPVEWDLTAPAGLEVMQIWRNYRDTPLRCKEELTDAVRMTENEHLRPLRERLLRGSSEATIKEVHEEATAEYNRLQALIEGEKLSKPFPPLPDTIGALLPYLWDAGDPVVIEHIENGLRLLEEGQAMHHCVASYVDQCLSGSSVIFSVRTVPQGTEKPVRATLELSRDGSIRQFKGPHNSNPAEPLHNAVSTWRASWAKLRANSNKEDVHV